MRKIFVDRGARAKDHTFLFNWVKQENPSEYAFTNEERAPSSVPLSKWVPLNESHFDCQINFLDYRKTTPKGKTHHFTWVTDIELTETTVYTVM